MIIHSAANMRQFLFTDHQYLIEHFKRTHTETHTHNEIEWKSITIHCYITHIRREGVIQYVYTRLMIEWIWI